MGAYVNFATSKDWNENLVLTSIGPSLREEEQIAKMSSSFMWYYISLPSDQSWFWSPQWQAGEAEADDDLREGRFKTFDHVDDFINFLDADTDE
jgi:hypothetical protein